METEYERSRIERLKRGLYAPGGTEGSSAEPELSKLSFDVHGDWEDSEALGETKVKQRYHGSVSAMVIKTFTILAILAVTGSVGYLAYTLFDPLAKPSDKNIDLLAQIPVAVSSGSVTPVSLTIENRNRIALDYAVLTAIYPPGTRSGTDSSQEMKDDRKILGPIESGKSAQYDAQVIFLGKENTDQNITFRLEYRFRGINSSFIKELPRPVRLNSSPVNIDVKTLSEVSSGQSVDFDIVATANTVVPIQNVVLSIDYPQGFQYLDATPEPTFANNGWSVGTLKPGDRFKVRLRGVLSGDDGQKRSFKTTVGSGDTQLSGAITEEFASALSTIALRASFIGVDLFFDDRPVGDSIANFGKTITGRVLWKNNLPVKILDAEIEVKLYGTALDRASIKANDGGFYRSLDDTIFWDKRNTPSLEVADIGEQGTVSFTFLPLPPVVNGQILKNPAITAEITVRGKRISETGVPEEVNTLAIKTVKVTSQVQFASRAIQATGPITNRGPIPPRVDQETTYTVVWSLVNSSNNVTGATVRAVIPPYARYTGTIYPLTEPVVYNDNTKQVIWAPGNIAAGVGVDTPPREVYFQIVIQPSLSQVRSSPEIIYKQDFSAQDAYTGEQFTQTRPSLTTAITTDPNITKEEGQVVP